jgi:hypothetical protein
MSISSREIVQPKSDLIRNLLYAVAHCIEESPSAASARQFIRARPVSGTTHPEIKSNPCAARLPKDISGRSIEASALSRDGLRAQSPRVGRRITSVEANRIKFIAESNERTP